MSVVCWKEKAAVGATVLDLAVRSNEMLAVKTAVDLDSYNGQQQGIEQGPDAVERENDRLRDQMRDGVDTENRRTLTPSEVRPVGPRTPRLRIRP